MEEFFIELEKIYEEFHEKYIGQIGVSCEDCNYCCTSKFTYPPISELEYDFIEREIKNKVNSLKEFMTTKNREKCPFYKEKDGCIYYNIRPFCCRLFGVFTSDGNLPPACPYGDYTKKIDERILFRLEPILKKFQILKFKYDLEKTESKIEKIEKLIHIIEELIAQNQIKETENYLKQLNKIKKNHPSYYFYSAIVFKRKNMVEDAIENFEKSIKLGSQKSYPYIYEYLGMIYYEIGELQKARKTLEKAMETYETSQACTGLALVNIKEASLLCKKALNIENDNEVAKYIMGKYFSEE